MNDSSSRDVEMAATANTSAARTPASSQPQPPQQQQAAQVHKHESSGYTWTRDEDAPGWAWQNKKAQDEALKAWEQVSEPRDVVGTRYPDPALIAPADTPWGRIL